MKQAKMIRHLCNFMVEHLPVNMQMYQQILYVGNATVW